MAFRNLLTLLVAGVISMWASAQTGTVGLSAAERLQLLKTNRELLDDLLDQGTLMADANTPIDRAAECQRTTDRLAREYRTALDRADADRAVEIGDHLDKIVSEGFAPNLESARRDSKPGSPDYERVQTIHRNAVQSLDDINSAPLPDGPLAKSKRLRQAREKLAATAAKLGKPDDR